MSLRTDTYQSAEELLEKFTSFDPGPDYAKIKDKMPLMMTQEELEIEQKFLERKLHHVNGYITRQLQKQQAIQTKPAKQNDQYEILSNSVKTQQKREKQYKRELQELESLLEKLADTNYPQKLQAQITNLSDSIHTTKLHIQKLTFDHKKTSLKSVVPEGDLKQEKQLVQLENDIVRMRLKLSQQQAASDKASQQRRQQEHLYDDAYVKEQRMKFEYEKCLGVQPEHNQSVIQQDRRV